MPERQPVLGERAVGFRQPHAGLEHGGERALVDATQAVHPPEVERDHRVEPPAVRLQSADHARPAAERHDRDAGLGARLQHGQRLIVVGRSNDGVGRPLAVARALGQQVEVGLAAAAQHARLAVVAHARRRPRSSANRRHVERRLAQPHVLERAPARHDRAVDAELAREERRARARTATGPRPARPSPRRPARASREHARAGRRARRRAPCRPRVAAATPPKRAQPRARWRQLERHPRAAVDRGSSRASTRRSRSTFANGVPSSSCAHARRPAAPPRRAASPPAPPARDRAQHRRPALTATLFTRSVRGHQRASARGSATTLHTASGSGRHGARARDDHSPS